MQFEMLCASVWSHAVQSALAQIPNLTHAPPLIRDMPDSVALAALEQHQRLTSAVEEHPCFKCPACGEQSSTDGTPYQLLETIVNHFHAHMIELHIEQGETESDFVFNLKRGACFSVFPSVTWACDIVH